MIYIFDTGVLIHFFNNYYKKRFLTLWNNFYEMVEEERIISVKMVFNELEQENANDDLKEWAKIKKIDFFKEPTEKEFEFVSEIFKNKHFQQLIKPKQIKQSVDIADPFLIAKARCIKNGCVVTKDGYYQDGKLKLNNPAPPFICNHFKIPCLNIEQFMEKENWTF